MCHLPSSSLSTAPKAGVCDGMMWGLQPILKALPAWWRFLQCLRRYRDLSIKSPVPHLMNAGKYSTTLIAIIFAAISGIVHSRVVFVLMVLARLVSSVCTTAWDLVMDWGLLDRHSKENPLLREELVYRFRAYYYGAIIEDVIIRFAWILPLAFRNFPQLVDTEIVTSVVMFAEVTRRIIWNFFRLENEHLNNCGNFRAVRDIGIAPIRKESPSPSGNVGQEGDKTTTYGMFNQLLTYTHNTGNTINRNTNANGCDGDSGSDDEDSNNQVSVGDNSADTLNATFAEYATILRQNNHKSLWNHLRATYFQQKKEKRRRIEIDKIAGMEEALWAARHDVQAKTTKMPPRGASPTEDPSEVQAKLYAKAKQVSSDMTPTTSTNTNASSIHKAPHSRKRLHSDSSVTCPGEWDAQSQNAMIDERQHKALVKATIPHAACFVGPQPSTSLENRASTCSAPFISTPDLPAFPSTASGNLLPRSGERVNVNRGLDLVTASEMLSHLNEDDSPDDTVLPIRTRIQANQLRELLTALNSGNSTQAPVVAGVKKPVSLSTSTASHVPVSSSRPRRWRLESTEALSTGGVRRLSRSQTAQRRKWIGNGGTRKSDAGVERKADVRVRPKSVGAMEGIDSDERGRHTSAETSTISLGEDVEDVEKGQRSSEKRPSYPAKFVVDRAENPNDDVARF
nr:xenotropic and polytropic retrovirus receptor 1 [Hymenolepis microstoma]